MPAIRLERRFIPKVWGRRDIPETFGVLPASGVPLGEVWFTGEGAEAELLVKYLFTSEKLSIQVHPGDAAARAAGHARGKDEAWVVLRADPGATIGLGLRREVSKEELRAAALDGRIEQILDWRPVKAGDVLFSPAGTVHALGAGLVVAEIQQNLDLTYRLYDYGRPRALHLDEGVAVANPAPHGWAFCPRMIAGGREVLVGGPSFMLERWRGREARIGGDTESPVWLIPLGGGASVDGTPLEAGSVWIARGPSTVQAGPESALLIAYSGGRIRFVD